MTRLMTMQIKTFRKSNFEIDRVLKPLKPVSFKDTLKACDDFKNKQKNCMKLCFLIRKSMYNLKVYSIRYTLR